MVCIVVLMYLCGVCESVLMSCVSLFVSKANRSKRKVKTLVNLIEKVHTSGRGGLYSILCGEVPL